MNTQRDKVSKLCDATVQMPKILVCQCLQCVMHGSIDMPLHYLHDIYMHQLHIAWSATRNVSQRLSSEIISLKPTFGQFEPHAQS